MKKKLIKAVVLLAFVLTSMVPVVYAAGENRPAAAGNCCLAYSSYRVKTWNGYKTVKTCRKYGTWVTLRAYQNNTATSSATANRQVCR